MDDSEREREAIERSVIADWPYYAEAGWASAAKAVKYYVENPHAFALDQVSISHAKQMADAAEWRKYARERDTRDPAFDALMAEVMRLRSQGLEAREIAALTGFSERSVAKLLVRHIDPRLANLRRDAERRRRRAEREEAEAEAAASGSGSGSGAGGEEELRPMTAEGAELLDRFLSGFGGRVGGRGSGRRDSG